MIRVGDSEHPPPPNPSSVTFSRRWESVVRLRFASIRYKIFGTSVGIKPPDRRDCSITTAMELYRWEITAVLRENPRLMAHLFSPRLWVLSPC